MPLAARLAQAQGTAPSICQDGDLDAEAAPVQSGLHLFLLGRARRAHARAHNRAVQPYGGQIWIGLQMGPRRGQTPRLHQAA